MYEKQKEIVKTQIHNAKCLNLWFCRTLKGIHQNSELWFSPYEAENGYFPMALVTDNTVIVELKDPHEYFHQLKNEAERIKMESIDIINKIKRAEQLNEKYKKEHEIYE